MGYQRHCLSLLSNLVLLEKFGATGKNFSMMAVDTIPSRKLQETPPWSIIVSP
jgi:hypothetical protein